MAGGGGKSGGGNAQQQNTLGQWGRQNPMTPSSMGGAAPMGQGGKGGKGGGGQPVQQNVGNMAGMPGMPPNMPGAQGMASAWGQRMQGMDRSQPPMGQYAQQQMAGGQWNGWGNAPQRPQAPQLSQADQDQMRSSINSMFGINPPPNPTGDNQLSAATGTDASAAATSPTSGTTNAFSNMSPLLRQQMADQMYGQMSGRMGMGGMGRGGMMGLPSLMGGYRGYAGGGQVKLDPWDVGELLPGQDWRTIDQDFPMPPPPPPPPPEMMPPMMDPQRIGYATGGRIAWNPMVPMGNTGITALPAITAQAPYVPPAQPMASVAPAAAGNSDDYAGKLMAYGKQNRLNAYAAQMGPQGMAYAMKNGFMSNSGMPVATTPTEKLLASMYQQQSMGRGGGGGGYAGGHGGGSAGAGNYGSSRTGNYSGSGSLS